MHSPSSPATATCNDIGINADSKVSNINRYQWPVSCCWICCCIYILLSAMRYLVLHDMVIILIIIMINISYMHAYEFILLHEYRRSACKLWRSIVDYAAELEFKEDETILSLLASSWGWIFIHRRVGLHYLNDEQIDNWLTPWIVKLWSRVLIIQLNPAMVYFSLA